MRLGRSVADPPDDPVVVEAMGEVAEGLVELSDCPEPVQPEPVLLEGVDEPLDASVALGLAHEGRARLDARSPQVVLEGVRDELASVVVAQHRALGDVGVLAAKDDPDRLPKALHGLVAPGSFERQCCDAQRPERDCYAPRTLVRLGPMESTPADGLTPDGANDCCW